MRAEHHSGLCRQCRWVVWDGLAQRRLCTIEDAAALVQFEKPGLRVVEDCADFEREAGTE